MTKLKRGSDMPKVTQHSSASPPLPSSSGAQDGPFSSGGCTEPFRKKKTHVFCLTMSVEKNPLLGSQMTLQLRLGVPCGPLWSAGHVQDLEPCYLGLTLRSRTGLMLYVLSRVVTCQVSWGLLGCVIKSTATGLHDRKNAALQ